MSANLPDPEKEPPDELLPNSAVDEFFDKMKHDFRRPKPSEEAVASALQAIQKLASDAAVEQLPRSQAQVAEENCPKCGASNSSLNRFCGYCGTAMGRAEKRHLVAETTQAPVPPEGQHFHHHHYHHHYFPESARKKEATDFRVDETPDSTSEGAEDEQATIQKLVRNWSVFCNSKRLDDLMTLYASDAILLRPNVELAHGVVAIRKLLEAALDAGLGDVQLECADIGIVGDFACLTGRSKMLVPVATAKRNEETGKYLIVARKEGANWKIVADSWCMDSQKAQSVPAPTSAAILPMRAQRK